MSFARIASRAAVVARGSFHARPIVCHNKLAVPAGTRLFSMRYSPTHEFVNMATGEVGITGHAAEALGDIVYVEMPEVGQEFEKEEVFGSVESVKAASDVYSPVGGKVVAINEALTDNPALVNEDAVSAGWFMKIEIADPSEADSLMDQAAYDEHCTKE